MISAVTSALLRQRPTIAWPPVVPLPLTPLGIPFGSHSAIPWASTIHSSQPLPTEYPCLWSLPSATAMDKSPKVASRSALKPFLRPSYRSQRRSPAWGPQTHVSTALAPWTNGCPTSTQPGPSKTLPLPVSNQFRLPFSTLPKPTPPPMDHKATLPPLTWPGWPSSSFSAQGSTAPQHSHTPSAWVTSVSVSKINTLTHAHATSPSSTMPNSVPTHSTHKKNRIRGEIIAHGRSGDPIACPLLTLLRRVIHLRNNHANAHTPLHAYFEHNQWGAVSPAMVSSRLRTAALAAGSTVGIHPTDISARALRAGGAMALLCANVDHNTIRLVGRWRSDAMLRYLHIQASTLVSPLAPAMLRGGKYTIPPEASIPTTAAATLARISTGTFPS